MIEGAYLPILGFAAWSGTGKTTLSLKVLPILKGRGLRVGMIKHAHHHFEIDYPGKDSYELRKAGAAQMLITSRQRWALMAERAVEREPRLEEALLELDQASLDLVLVEGFKDERFPKIELHRPSQRRPLLFPVDDTIIAVAADAALERACALPLLDLNDPEQVTEFITARVMGAHPASSRGASSR